MRAKRSLSARLHRVRGCGGGGLGSLYGRIVGQIDVGDFNMSAAEVGHDIAVMDGIFEAESARRNTETKFRAPPGGLFGGFASALNI